jgi:hypothetical protein
MMASAGNLRVEINKRVVVGLLGPVAMALGWGSEPGDQEPEVLVYNIVQAVLSQKQQIENLEVELRAFRREEARQRDRQADPELYQLHDLQFRILNINDEVVWSGEWKVDGNDGLQRLAAASRLIEMRDNGTDFGMRIERYQRCRWVNLTTQAHDEPDEYDGGVPG